MGVVRKVRREIVDECTWVYIKENATSLKEDLALLADPIQEGQC